MMYSIRSSVIYVMEYTVDLDANAVLAMLMGIIRMERFCDGLILSCLKEGKIQKLLQRLRDT